MPRRSLEERDIRKLLKQGNGSVTVTLPIEYIRELKWKDGQKVVVKKTGNKLTIEDWQG